MPVYEYKCQHCGYRFALLEPLGTPDGGRECPKCGGKDTRRIISTFTPVSSARDTGGCKPGGG